VSLYGGADHRDPACCAVGREAREAGGTVKEITRRHGICEQSFYRWKAKYGGLEVSEARRLKALEAENAKLKKLLAEAHLDNAALKDVLSRKW
jgi:putative transposase